MRYAILAFTGMISASPILAGSLQPVTPESLCVTEGSLTQLTKPYLEVAVPKMRAVLKTQTRQLIEAQFKYMGPTDEIQKLGSGEIRYQFGLKLRAADPCNLLYVMWRIEENASAVHVQIKANPGQSKSSACENHGYRTIATRAFPVLNVDSLHKLRASLSSSKLVISVDAAPAWNIDVDPAALRFDGPVGLRSDNVHLKLKVLAPAEGTPVGCTGRGGED